MGWGGVGADVMEKNLAWPVTARRAGSWISMGDEVSTRGSVKPVPPPPSPTHPDGPLRPDPTPPAAALRGPCGVPPLPSNTLWCVRPSRRHRQSESPGYGCAPPQFPGRLLGRIRAGAVMKPGHLVCGSDGAKCHAAAWGMTWMPSPHVGPARGHGAKRGQTALRHRRRERGGGSR